MNLYRPELNQKNSITGILKLNTNNGGLREDQQKEMQKIVAVMEALEKNSNQLDLSANMYYVAIFTELHTLFSTRHFRFTYETFHSIKRILSTNIKQIKDSLLNQNNKLTNLDSQLILLGNIIRNGSTVLPVRSRDVANSFETHLIKLSEIQSCLSTHEILVLSKNLSLFITKFEELLNGSKLESRINDIVFLSLIQNYSEQFLATTNYNYSHYLAQIKESIQQLGSSAIDRSDRLKPKSQADTNHSLLIRQGLALHNKQFAQITPPLVLYEEKNQANLGPLEKAAPLITELENFINESDTFEEDAFDLVVRWSMELIGIFSGNNYNSPDSRTIDVPMAGIMPRPIAQITIIREPVTITQAYNSEIRVEEEVLRIDTLYPDTTVIAYPGTRVYITNMIGGRVHARGGELHIVNMNGGTVKFVTGTEARIDNANRGAIHGFNLRCANMSKNIVRDKCSTPDFGR